MEPFIGTNAIFPLVMESSEKSKKSEWYICDLFLFIRGRIFYLVEYYRRQNINYLESRQSNINCTFYQKLHYPWSQERFENWMWTFCTRNYLPKPKRLFIVIGKIYVNLRQKCQNKVKFSMKNLDQTRNKLEHASLV